MKELKNKNLLCLVLVLICSVLIVTLPGKAAEDNQGNQLQLNGVDSSNGLEAVWIEGNDENGYGLYYTKYSNKTWQSKQLIVQSNQMLVTPCIGGDGSQGNMLVWSVINGSSSDLYFSLYKEGAWSSPKKIETNLASNLSPSLLVDGKNQFWLAWVGLAGTDDDIYFSRWNGSNWAAPIQVNEDNDTPDLFPVLGLGSNGNPWIQWYGYENGKYTQFRRDWNGSSWVDRQEMTGRAVAIAGFSLTEAGINTVTNSTFAKQEGENGTQTSIVLPDFIQKPEHATLHILKSKTGIQTLPVRDLYEE